MCMGSAPTLLLFFLLLLSYLGRGGLLLPLPPPPRPPPPAPLPGGEGDPTFAPGKRPNQKQTHAGIPRADDAEHLDEHLDEHAKWRPSRLSRHATLFGNA